MEPIRKYIEILVKDQQRKTITLAPANMDSLIESISRFMKADKEFVESRFDIIYVDDSETENVLYDDDSYSAALLRCLSETLTITLVPTDSQEQISLSLVENQDDRQLAANLGNNPSISENVAQNSPAAEQIANNVNEFDIQQSEMIIYEENKQQPLQDQHYDANYAQQENFLQQKEEKIDESKGSIDLCFLGESATGKSCIITQYCCNYFEQNFDPTLQETFTKSVTVNRSNFQLNILDTNGMEDYQGLIDQWICNKDGFVIVYSVWGPLAPRDGSKIRMIFENIQNQYDMTNRGTAPVIALAANMIDRSDRVVTKEWGENLAKELGIFYFETSAKNNINIEVMFDHILNAMISNRAQRPEFETSAIRRQKKSKCTIF